MRRVGEAETGLWGELEKQRLVSLTRTGEADAGLWGELEK